MTSFRVFFCTAVFAAATLSAGLLPAAYADEKYEYNWESIKTAPIPEWFDDAKFGIFIHWGPYSVVGHKRGGRGYAEWLPHSMYQTQQGENEYYNDYLENMFGAHPPEFGYKDMRRSCTPPSRNRST